MRSELLTESDVNALFLVTAPVETATLEPTNAFSELAWRGRFGEYREIVKDTTECSDVVHFAALWATCSVRLRRSVYMDAGDRVYPNVYLCFFGESGDKKTTGERKPRALGLLEDINIIGVGSPEGIAQAMMPDKENGSQGSTVLFYVEEISSLLARGQWKGNTILPFLTETYDCPNQYRLDYKKDNKVLITEPTPTLLTATTIDWFWKNARPEDFHGGFGNRFVYLTGNKKAPMPNPKGTDQEKVQLFRQSIMRLGEDFRGQLRFSPEAEELWSSFYLDFESKDRPGLFGVALKRLHTNIRKLAMVYAATEGTAPEISCAQLEAAIAVGLYAANCTRVLIDSQNAHARPEAELEQRFIAWVAKNNGHKKRYMQQSLTKYAGSCEVFNRVLNNLVRAGHIEIEDGKVFNAR